MTTKSMTLNQLHTSLTEAQAKYRELIMAIHESPKLSSNEDHQQKIQEALQIRDELEAEVLRTDPKHQNLLQETNQQKNPFSRGLMAHNPLATKVGTYTLGAAGKRFRV